MASIWKDPRTRFWIACFTDKDGRRRKKSTKTTDARKARKFADEFEKVSRQKQTAKSARATITTLVDEIWDVKLPQVSARDHIAAWLTEKESSTAASTLDFYKQSTTKFIGFLGTKAGRPIDEIDRATIAAFKTEMSKTLAAKTVNHHLKCIRMVFNAAKRDDHISEDPTEFVEVIKRKQTSARRAFTIDEVKLILSKADPEWKSMILTGIYTGQRLADIACLTWQNVDLKAETITLTTRKTGKSLQVPIAAPLKKHLESLPTPEDQKSPLHPSAYAIIEKQGKSGSLSNKFSAILVAAGLRTKESISKKSTGKGRSTTRVQNELSFHCLRHTAVSLLKEAGIPAAVVMEMIGHDSEQMSQHYTHVGKEALKKAAESMPDVFNED